jgi:hypothetical protein
MDFIDIDRICQYIDIQKRKGLHINFLRRLKFYFKTQYLGVRREYALKYQSIHRKTGELSWKTGLIDLVVFIEAKKLIAVEFDSGKKLKYKSLEKLLYSNSEVLIGIVRGSHKESYEKNRENNLGRLKEVIEEYKKNKTKDPVFQEFHYINLIHHKYEIFDLQLRPQ